jgi:hypothetical protein
MKKFYVGICRTSYAFDRFEVEAETETEAIDKAMAEATNTVFTEDDAEYSVEGVEVYEEGNN